MILSRIEKTRFIKIIRLFLSVYQYYAYIIDYTGKECVTILHLLLLNKGRHAESFLNKGAWGHPKKNLDKRDGAALWLILQSSVDMGVIHILPCIIFYVIRNR